MIIYSLNASPRKNWNDAQLLKQFKEGILSVDKAAEIKEIHLYDLNYKGCISCFGCKLKITKETKCIIQDEIFDLLYNIRHSDGLVYASPIYFSDATGEFKSFLERLLYPGPTDFEIPVFAIYTMNADHEKLERVIRPSLNIIRDSLKKNFHTEPDELFAFQTLQRNHQELYKPSSHSNPQERMLRHKIQWPKDLQAAYHAGKTFAQKIQKKQ